MATTDLTFRHNGVALTGHLAWDASRAGKRPAVLVIHEATGLGPQARAVAERIAEEFGYVAYAMDLFGETPGTMQAILGWIQRLLADPAELRGRVNGALAALSALHQVDATRLAAIGYCFGGTAAIELARSGADVKAVVAFHAGLQGTSNTDAAAIKGKILVCNGAQDPFMPAQVLQSFSAEMIAAGVNWQMNLYGRARHSFTNLNASDLGSDAYAYDADADRRSWQAMSALFAESLA